MVMMMMMRKKTQSHVIKAGVKTLCLTVLIKQTRSHRVNVPLQSLEMGRGWH